jgi:hypothetical protein
MHQYTLRAKPKYWLEAYFIYKASVIFTFDPKINRGHPQAKTIALVKFEGPVSMGYSDIG